MSKLDAETLIRAYASGLFPMALEDDRFRDADDSQNRQDSGQGNGSSQGRSQIGWFSPDPRGVIPLEDFHIPHGLRKVLQKDPFTIRIDFDFPAVIAACADRAETWISGEIRESFTKLHNMGCAHSVESWQNGELVGGLYGVALGGAFFGESMFSRVSNASKVALVALVERLRDRGFTLLDTQWTNPHLEQFGCREITRADYLRQLDAALRVETTFCG